LSWRSGDGASRCRSRAVALRRHRHCWLRLAGPLLERRNGQPRSGLRRGHRLQYADFHFPAAEVEKGVEGRGTKDEGRGKLSPLDTRHSALVPLSSLFPLPAAILEIGFGAGQV